MVSCKLGPFLIGDLTGTCHIPCFDPLVGGLQRETKGKPQFQVSVLEPVPVFWRIESETKRISRPLSLGSSIEGMDVSEIGGTTKWLQAFAAPKAQSTGASIAAQHCEGVQSVGQLCLLT